MIAIPIPTRQAPRETKEVPAGVPTALDSLACFLFTLTYVVYIYGNTREADDDI